jgi:ribosomal protein L9
VQTFTYSFVDDADGRFKIVRDKIQVASSTKKCGTSVCKINYEVDKTHTVKVKVVDSGKPAMSATFTHEIVVKDANDRPTIGTALSNAVIYENAKAGTEIGKKGVSLGATLFTTPCYR